MYQLDHIWVGPKKRSFEKLTKSKRLSKSKFRLEERSGDSLTQGLLGAKHSVPSRNTS